MELPVGRNEATQLTEAVVFLYGDRPFAAEIVSSSSCRIKFQTFHASGVIRIHNWVVDEIPTMKV